jgi:hypothetical protein
MAPRSRSQSSSIINGTWARFGSTSGGGVIQTKGQSTNDHTGIGDNNPFLMHSWERSGGVIHDQHSQGYWGAYFQNYHSDGGSDSNFPHLSVSGVLSDGDCAIQGINRSSPSSAYVDVPANLLQLGELAHLLKATGDDAKRGIEGQYGKRAARGYLAQQFGLLPYVGDLLKLWKFEDQVDRRLKQLDKLRGPRGFRKTMEIGAWENKTSYNHVFQSQGQYSALPVTAHTIIGKRVHCRWSPDNTPILENPFHQRRQVQRALLGFQQNIIDAATLWEITPWSWLVDWAYDVGGYLKTFRNSVPAILTGITVMERTLSVYSAPGYNWPDWYGRSQTAFSFKRETKRRSIPIVAPSAHFPFLTGNQMGIVASLAIAKA